MTDNNLISEKINSDNQWRIITMEELFDYLNKDNTQNIFIKPKFPNRRWGHIYTKISTTNILEINISLKKLKENGYIVRKRLDKKTNLGKFYRIKIKNNNNLVN